MPAGVVLPCGYCLLVLLKYFRNMARKYRRRRRRSSYKRRRGRYQRFRPGNKPEVKYYTNNIQNQALKLHINSTDSDTLFAEQTYLSNILSEIDQGVGSGSRIGSKIYVMKIAVRMQAWSCPADDTYVLGPFLNRHIWHSSANIAGTAVPDFFLAQAKVNFIHWPDRRVFTIHRDKVFKVSDGVYNVDIGGSMRYITYNIPVNRYVTYTLTNKVKEDYNIYSLAMLTSTTGMGDAANNLKQVGCFNLTYRIYFKDA